MGQTLHSLTYHLVFSTKNRESCLTKSLRNKLCEFLTAYINSNFGYCHEINGHLDHIHILCDIAPKNSISYFVKEIKVKSSVHLKSIMNCHFSWQSGYGAFSVSKSNISAVKKYIQNQEEHHRKLSFKDEFRKFLAKHEVEYDEKYIWS